MNESIMHELGKDVIFSLVSSRVSQPKNVVKWFQDVHKMSKHVAKRMETVCRMPVTSHKMHEFSVESLNSMPVVLQTRRLVAEVWDTPLPMPEWDPSYVSW